MTKTNKKFKITSELSNKQITKKSLDLNDDGSLELEGVASTSNKDLQGDVISRECIEKMKTQALNRNIHADHIYDLDDVIGAITEVYDTDSTTLKIKFKIIPSVAPKIKELLDTGVHLGLSIGGNIIDYTETYTNDGDYGWIVNDINLLEISLTPLPANWDSYGTVTSAKGLVEAKCLTGACSLIRKNLKEESESEADAEVESEKDLTVEDAKNLMVNALEGIDSTKTSDEDVSDDRFDDLSKSELKELLLKEIEKNETTNDVTEEDIEDTNKNMEEEIRKEITEEDVMSMIDEVASTMKEQVIAEVKDTLKTEITDGAITEIRDQITDELLGQIKDDVTTEIQSSIMDEVMTEVDAKISEAIAEEQAAEEADDKDPEDNPEDTEPPADDDSEMQDSVEESESEKEEEPVDVQDSVEEEIVEEAVDDVKSVEDVNDQKAISMHRLQRNIEKNIEAKILSQLGVERAPVSETEKIVKKWLASKEEPRINKRKTMSRQDLAVRMTDTSNSQSPYYRVLKEMQEE